MLCLRRSTAEGPADCLGEAQESDVFLSHGRAAFACHPGQPLHRPPHRSAADRVRDIRPQLLHPVLPQQRKGAQGEARGTRPKQMLRFIVFQQNSLPQKSILVTHKASCFVMASSSPSPLLYVLFSHNTLHSL